MSETAQKFTYKDRPLVRCGDEMYYGSMEDKFIIYMKITSYLTLGDIKVPSRIEIQLQYTDPDIKGNNKIVRSGDRDSISKAFVLADAWLSRSN
ncbi:MAG: hypothetical protein J6L81_08580 [Clostridia bacterium]|nr:hypothetical protein [Clostridia bacterium]